jgi:hypothetical protein
MPTTPPDSPSPASFIPTSRNFAVVRLANNKAIMDMTLSLLAKPGAIRDQQEKLFVNCTQILKPQDNVKLSHAIDGPTFRVIAHAITQQQWSQAIGQHLLGPEPACKTLSHPQKPEMKGYQWTDYKGGADRRHPQQIISRVLLLTFWDVPGQNYPWTLTLTEGPGKLSPTQAVMPAGPITKKVMMRLSWVQILQWMLLGQEALAALTAHDVAQWSQ